MEGKTPKHAVVSSKELGAKCWDPARFVEGTRCRRVMSCTYPEKKTCKAVTAELIHLNSEVVECQKRAADKIAELIKSVEELNNGV